VVKVGWKDNKEERLKNLYELFMKNNKNRKRNGYNYLAEDLNKIDNESDVEDVNNNKVDPSV
jgi:hypothetical protein